jgi:hypothetical protein
MRKRLFPKGTSFKDCLEVGRLEEEYIAKYFKEERGCSIMPLYQFKEHNAAPFMEVLENKKILPDLIAFDTQGKDRVYFIECKRKGRWVGPYWRKDYGFTEYLCEKEGGVDTRLVEQYKEIMDETNIPVYICFTAEGEEPRGLFLLNLEEAYPHGRKWKGITMFPFDLFTTLKREVDISHDAMESKEELAQA